MRWPCVRSQTQDSWAKTAAWGGIGSPGRVCSTNRRRKCEVLARTPRAGRVDLALYDILGKRVRNLTSQGWFDAGQHRMLINADGLPSGMYSLEIRAGELVQVGSISLVK